MLKVKNYRKLNYQRNLIENEKNNINNNNDILYQKDKKIKYKGIKIPKLFLNKNINNFYNTKRVSYSHRKINKISSENFTFLKMPQKNELTNYFFSKNKTIIDEISLNSKRKLNNLSTMNNISISERGKKKLNVRSRLFDFENKNINNVNNITIKKDKLNLKEKESMNKSFLSSKVDDPLLDKKIKKYLKKKEDEREKLFTLVNNPFKRKGKPKGSLFPFLDKKIIIKKLKQQNTIDNDIYISILDEYNKFDYANQIKQYLKKEYENEFLSDKIYKNKLTDKSKIFINAGKVQKRLLDNEMSLIKSKINKKFWNEVNYDFLDDYNSKLYVSVSNCEDQLFNTRVYPKFLNDNIYIKNLIEEVTNKYNKK